MKILVLAAVIVAVSSGRLSGSKSAKVEEGEKSQWPWQVGTLYRYDVETHNLAYLQESASTGNSFKARFTVRVKAPGYLQAKLENPRNALIHQALKVNEPLPEDLKYEPVPKLDMPFEIYYDGGRILSLNLPATVSLAHENLLKGLVGALQVDLSTKRNVPSSHDTYDKESQQGLFRKMETDVTGDCETLYTVSPVAAEWRRELPTFISEEDPMEITKSKNYGHCHHRVDYHFGVPQGAEWSGTVHKAEKEQFIHRSMVSRILVGKNGPIYKSETTSTVKVHPHLYGKQKAEVHSKVSFYLVSQVQDSEPEWPQPEGVREVQNLLYSLTPKQITIDDDSSSSSSESVENHIDVQKYNRERRSARPKSFVAINKVIIKKRSEETSSSSSSESGSAYVNDNIPKTMNEPAYAALYMNPQPHNDKKQNPMNAQKLVQEISQQLQNPNNMPKVDLLSKFNILVRVIASMSYGQLSQASRSIEIAKSSSDNVKSDMWMVYRDAVAQAGTLPAFQQVKSWIQSKKLEGEEAAEVISSMVKSLRYPTKDSMIQFFELAMSPEVRSQKYLNSSALIAATTYINMGQVNNETSYRYYPTHMYGRLSQKHDHFVELEILPRLTAEFRLAMEQGDTHKSQVYIKAIGNLGHGAILDVFVPYLEGKIPTSTYLRTRMVESLNVLAYQRDYRVRAVLFSILKNTAEPYEVRVAAIHNIFMGRPTSAMMQAMAYMTKVDPSRNVRSVLKSAIESVAQLKHPRFYEIARTAESVKDMLTEEDFGLQYSKKNLVEYFDRDDQYGLMSILSTIGSKDGLFPKSLKYSWKNRVSGWDEEATLWTAASNGQKVLDYFFDQIFANKEYSNGEVNHKYTAKKISEILNINHVEEPLEASIYMDIMNQQRYFAFNEQDIKDFSVKVGEYLSDLVNGVNKHYTKIVNRNQVSVMFPIASGMPFIYKYKEPTVVHIQASSKGKVDFKNRENYETDVAIDKDLWFTYATNNDGSVGYLDTLSNQYPTVGLVRKFQLHLPIKMHVETKRGEFKLRLAHKETEQDSTIVHYSVWPYSSSQKKDTLVTISQDPSTKVIARPNKVLTVDYKFGQQIGQLFHVQGYSYSNDYRHFGNFLKYNDVLSNIVSAFRQQDIAQTHFNFRYLGKQSKNKEITFTALYDTLYNQKNEGEMPSVATDMNDFTPNSPVRRHELVKRVTAGIKAARAQVLDLSLQIDSPEKLEYAMTFAVGNSHVDRKIQYAFFASKNLGQTSNQINAIGTLTKPLLISPMNFQDAIQQELKMIFETDIRYNQKENIHIQGTTERTMKYSEELQKHPLGVQCIREIESGNYYQRACHQAIILAHAPDSFKFAVTYKDVNPMVKSVFYQLHRIAQSLGIWQLESNDQKVNPVGKIDINVDASYLSHTLNLGMKSPLGEMRWKNVRIPKSSAVALATYWPIEPAERVWNYYSSHQYQPYCSVDNSMVRSFSDRSYNYKLTNSWHVVLHDDRVSNSDDLVVLARRPNEKQQEIYISYRSYTGINLEVEVHPAPAGHKNHLVKVNTNAKKVSEGDLTTYWDDVDETPVLEYYTEGNYVLVLKIRENRLRIMYDGLRSVVLASEKRKNIRGICGYMSGEPRDDYLTPIGIIDKPEYYAASYVLIGEDSEPLDKERQEQAKRMAYQPRKRYTTILRSDEEWKNEMRLASEEPWGSQIIYRARNYLKEKMPCELRPQVQYYENQGEICITTTALPACQSHCSGEGYEIKPAQVVCKSKFDLQFRSVRDQIRLGQNPQVSGLPQNTQFRVPASCIV